MELVFPFNARITSARRFEVLEVPRVELNSSSDSRGPPPPPPPPAAVPLPLASTAAAIRQRIEHGNIPSASSAPPAQELTGRSRRLASLQSALAILCHIAAMDKSSHFVRKAPVSSAASHGPFTLTDVYTTLRALKLEYEDALQQHGSGSGKHVVDPRLLLATEERIDACLPLLESTVLRMILDLDNVKHVPAKYTGGILRALPQVFAVEGWPCTVLRKEDIRRTSKRPRDEPCDDAGHVTTVVVLQTLRAMERRDAVALLRPPRESDEATRFNSFDELMSRAWDGVYRTRGLYGALYDMRALLYRLYASAQPEQAQAVADMGVQFEHELRYNYGAFLRRAGLDVGKSILPDETIFDILPLPNIRMEAMPKIEGEKGKEEKTEEIYTETQRKCLRLLKFLRDVDTEQWFEFPVFDMANIELSSIERWICGAAFSAKTSRESFVALRDVLEQMVDNCVLSYGPTSPFSQVITKVRQRLVGAAREVGLL